MADQSERVLGAVVQVVCKLGPESVSVGAELGELHELALAERMHWVQLVLQDVEGEAGQDEVSNRQIVAAQELVDGIHAEVLLDDSEEFRQDTISPSLHLRRFLFGWGEDDRTCDRVESISVGLNDHIDHSSLLPVLRIVIAELDAKLAKKSIGLLARLSVLVDDGHAAELASVAGSLARTPSLLADLNLLV